MLPRTMILSPEVETATSAATADSAAGSIVPFGKKNPFPAEVRVNERLSSQQSAKESVHIEFSLAGSGLTYTPGDTLAVQPVNQSSVVADILQACKIDADQVITTKTGESKSISKALAEDYDITTLSPAILKKLATKVSHPDLAALLDENASEALKSYLDGRQLIDALEDFAPAGLAADALLDILRTLQVRLYSIASSQLALPEAVALCVSAVRYTTHGRTRHGVCSTFLADFAPAGTVVKVFPVANKNFRLPENPSTPIIMVGPGVGIAPFRAFVQHRAALGAKGESWLFMGDQHYLHDFLYQTEWQEHLKNGSLTRLDVAFSRDQPQKIYVQHRLAEHSAEVFRWLENGAHFYVCGDASRMAKDVHNTLLDIVSKEGNMTPEQAAQYLDNLKKSQRYQRDVY